MDHLSFLFFFCLSKFQTTKPFNPISLGGHLAEEHLSWHLKGSPPRYFASHGVVASSIWITYTNWNYIRFFFFYYYFLVEGGGSDNALDLIGFGSGEEKEI